MIKLSRENVLLLHQLTIMTSGGEEGVRDYGLLDSAVNGTYLTFDGKELYPTKEEKAARLGFSLIMNHAFFDGNKRIGLLSMLSFLAVNGIYMKYTDQELVKIGFSIAEGAMQYEDLLSWVKHHKIHSKNNEAERNQ